MASKGIIFDLFIYIQFFMTSLHISETRPSEMTKDEAHRSNTSEEWITNMAYVNTGDGKEEKEKGKGKGQEGWQKKCLIT